MKKKHKLWLKIFGFSPARATFVANSRVANSLNNKNNNIKKKHKLWLKISGFSPARANFVANSRVANSLNNKNNIYKKTQTLVENFWIFASPGNFRRKFSGRKSHRCILPFCREGDNTLACSLRKCLYVKLVKNCH